MGKLIKEESNQERGVNFQKASCTLDASVKIYSHRVDDTHASSHRILESLSRNGTQDDNEGAEPGSAKVGTKSSSNRHNIADTIERDLEKINSVVVEKVQTADPMFHKMSKAFDEGGAKGMLMVNLRMAPNSSSLVFNLETINKEQEVQSTAAAEVVDVLPIVEAVEATVAVPEVVAPEAPSSADSSIVDISTLIMKSGFTYMDLAKMTICPALDEYRKTLEIEDNNTGSVTSEFVAEQIALVTTSEPVANSSSSPIQNNDDVMDYGDDDNGYGFECYDDNDDDAQVIAPQETRKSFTPNRRLSGAPKLDWDDIPQTRVPFGGSSEPETEQAESNVETGIAAITSDNEYNFFDMNMISKSNAWAGARHWKFATRISSRIAKQDEAKTADVAAEETNDDAREKTKQSRNKKEKSKIDFFDEWVSEDSFVIPGRSDTTVLTSAAILKNEAASSEGALFLPPDAKLEIRDLCRLFLCNRILVPPSNMENILASKSKNLRQQRFQGIISSSTVGQADIVWGAKSKQNTNAGFMRPVVAQDHGDYVGGDDDDDNYGEYGNTYDDCGHQDHQDAPAPTIQEEENGLAINSSNLMQATRKVEKVNIGYATIAKRVNVKKLKSDIWTKIDDDCISPSLSSENKNPNENDENMNVKCTKETSKQLEKMSFKEMITDIAENQEQKEVSLSFYFICLLHLANEKTLTIKGTQGMDDLIISKDL